MCVHDMDGHSPCAHTMLTMRPLTKEGKGRHKTEKEYHRVREDEGQGFTAAKFKSARSDG